MKEELKKLKIMKPILNSRKKKQIKKEFLNEYKEFNHYYTNSENILNKLEYTMLLNIHALEKGMLNDNPRPFGKEKINTLLNSLNQYYLHSNNKNINSFAVELTISILNSYINFYKKNNWENKEEYNQVLNFLKSYKKNNLLSGAHTIEKEKFIDNTKFDFFSFLKSRHSTRSFKNIPLKKEDIKKAIEMAILSPSACNRQMCKIFHIKNKDLIINYLSGIGNFDLKNNIDFFLVTFDMDNYLFLSDRHEGWFNAGLISMNFVNALHSLGIGSCFLQFGNLLKEEKELKEKLNIPLNNRIAIVIAAGYYKDSFKVAYSTRKNINDVYFEL